jgi:hypothetical protein
MSWETMPLSEIEKVTALLMAASWCKSSEMESALAQVIIRNTKPPIFIKESKQ